MPPHPTDACYASIVAAGARNVQRLAAAGDLAGVAVEAEHLAFVAGLLDAYLLYRGTPRFDESLHGRYWREVRATYKERAGPGALDEMDTHWYFLAFALGHPQDAEPGAAADRGLSIDS
ncbi:hypothetical protein J0H58_36780 [bacterium]|nr:hypothetical protein [bacterium]